MTDDRDSAASPPADHATHARVREPAFNLPPGLVLILAVLIAIHVIRTYILPASVDEDVVFNFAFLPARYDHSLTDQNLGWLWSPVTYSFLHASWDHVLFNGFWMIAFGAPVIRRIGMKRLALFWCLSAIAAVALHTVFHWGEMIVVVGASGVVAGLMGAAARFVFSRDGGIDRQSASFNRRLTIREALSNRSVLFFSGIWFLTNLLTGIGVFAFGNAGTIAWEAHIGGFLFGFFLFGLFDPFQPLTDTADSRVDA